MTAPRKSLGARSSLRLLDRAQTTGGASAMGRLGGLGFQSPAGMSLRGSRPSASPSIRRPPFSWWVVIFSTTPMRARGSGRGAPSRASGGFISILWGHHHVRPSGRPREAAHCRYYPMVRPVGEAVRGEAPGLMGSDGVVLGKLDQDYLRHDGAGACGSGFAPTGSGQWGGACGFRPLLTWPGSAIVHDTWAKLGLDGRFPRAPHGRVLRFRSDQSVLAGLQPVCSIVAGASGRCVDVQNVAHVLVRPRRLAGKTQNRLGKRPRTHAGRCDPADSALRRTQIKKLPGRKSPAFAIRPAPTRSNRRLRGHEMEARHPGPRLGPHSGFIRLERSANCLNKVPTMNARAFCRRPCPSLGQRTRDPVRCPL